MSFLFNIVLVVQVLSAMAMIGLILIQHGKGADMGAAFGSGSAGSLFGATGSANFLSRTTGILAAVFLVSTLALAHFGNSKPQNSGSVLEQLPVVAPVDTSPAAQIPGNLPAANAPEVTATPVSVEPPVTDNAAATDGAKAKDSTAPK